MSITGKAFSDALSGSKNPFPKARRQAGKHPSWQPVASSLPTKGTAGTFANHLLKAFVKAFLLVDRPSKAAEDRHEPAGIRIEPLDSATDHADALG